MLNKIQEMTSRRLVVPLVGGSRANSTQYWRKPERQTLANTVLKLLLIGFVAALVFTATFQSSSAIAEDKSEAQLTPFEIFDQRIMPIFRSPKPSSCVQCHLAAVDLKNYILPSQEKTFASLRDQGLIDLDAPERSKILTLIKMGDTDLDKGARLIHEKTRKAEFEAFAAWIKACTNDPKMRGLAKLSAAEQAGPPKPLEVIRHARKSRIVDSFVRNVWSQRMRCFPCHTPHEIDASNPRHQAAVKTHTKFEKEYGAKLIARLKIFRETPEATLQYLIEKSRSTPKGEIPLINLENPRRSLMVMKPTSKLPKKNENGKFEIPTNTEPMFHLGGLKMHRDDQSYKAFIAWIQDYANVVGNRYASVEELPADNWYPSKLIVRVTQVPKSWPAGIPVQLFVHSWNSKNESWDAEPVAFTQGTVTPRRMVNGALFLLANTKSKQAKKLDRENASLPRGRYLIKTYVDSKHRLADDPTLLLGKEDFSGQAVLKKARWRNGFRQAETIFGKQLSKKQIATTGR